MPHTQQVYQFAYEARDPEEEQLVVVVQNHRAHPRKEASCEEAYEEGKLKEVAADEEGGDVEEDGVDEAAVGGGGREDMGVDVNMGERDLEVGIVGVVGEIRMVVEVAVAAAVAQMPWQQLHNHGAGDPSLLYSLLSWAVTVVVAVIVFTQKTLIQSIQTARGINP